MARSFRSRRARWCVADMPLQAGTPIYNEPEAERAWSNLAAHYKTALS